MDDDFDNPEIHLMVGLIKCGQKLDHSNEVLSKILTRMTDETIGKFDELERQMERNFNSLSSKLDEGGNQLDDIAKKMIDNLKKMQKLENI